MITSITKIKLCTAISLEAAKKEFTEIAPMFKNPQGLIRKQFLLSENGALIGGVYLWQDMESARNFNENILMGMVKQKYGVLPEVDYFETPVIVDNSTGEIIST